MRLDPGELLEGYLNPDPVRVGFEAGLSMEAYKRAPGFNPSLVKLADPRLRTNEGTKGHPLRVLAKLAGWLEPKTAKHLDLGSLYHALLFEPETVEERFAVITPELEAELVEIARERKVAEEAPKEFSFRFGAAKEWRKLNGPKAVPSDEEKEALLETARQQVRDKVEMHPRLTELTEWKAMQEAKGKTVVDLETTRTAERMVTAILEEPYNRDVAEYLEEHRAEFVQRAEVSLFVATRLSTDGPVLQLKGRPDLLPSGPDWLDPKSGLSCHPDSFSYETKNRGYDLSMGGYAYMLHLLSQGCDAGRAGLTKELKAFYGLPKRRAGFLVQESSPPYLARLRWMDEQWLNYGAWRFVNALNEIVRCWESGDWSCEESWGSGTLLPPYGYEVEIESAPQILPAAMGLGGWDGEGGSRGDAEAQRPASSTYPFNRE